MRFITLLATLAVASAAFAQNNADPFNSARVQTQKSQGNPFNQNRADNFNDYRGSLNEEYAKMLREGHWDKKEPIAAEKDPINRLPVVPPVIYDGKTPIQGGGKEVPIKETVTPPKPTPPVAPVAPIKDNGANCDAFNMTFYGTPVSLRVPRGRQFRLGAISPQAYSNAWQDLSNPDYAGTLVDLLKTKQQLNLCDWAYLELINKFASAFTSDANSATFLTAYLYCQSGYKIRLAHQGNTVDFLFATDHKLFDKIGYRLDGQQWYWPYKTSGGSMQVLEAKFPREQSTSLWVNSLPSLNSNPTQTRTLKSKRYPEFTFQVSVNKNLIDLYDTYPTSQVGGNMMSRWAMYANTPLSPEVKKSLYPALKQMVAGLDELSAVEKILNWVQTAFVYEYDTKVWGEDRAFFGEETLFYPYCDCEDRSILFTRLVRDILGLKCMLVFYPGHLAAAVQFNSPVKGDYISLNGQKFTVTDPTYIGAYVGMTMPNMDNASATVVVL